MDFLVARDDLHRIRFEDAGVPEPAEGQALLAVDAFGLSANNITYATFGEAMSYWSFFPAEEGWGRVPVWGFAEVGESRHEGLPAGTRVYGYLPPSSHVVLTPERVVRERTEWLPACGRILIFSVEGELFFGASASWDGR